MLDNEAQNSRQRAGAAVGGKSGHEETADANRLKKQIKFYASELNVNRNIDQLYYNTNEEEQEVRKQEAQMAEQEMRVDESAGILASGKVVHDQGDDLVVLGHRDGQRNPLANYARDQRGPESAQEGKARLNFGYFAKMSESTPGANRVPSNTKQKKQMAPSEVLNMTKERKAKVAQEPRASLARSQLAQPRDSFKEGDVAIKSQRQVAQRPSTDNMIIGRADLPNNGNIAGQYLVQGDGGLAGYHRQAAGDQEPIVDSRNQTDATAARQPKVRPSNALQTRSERYSRKDPLVDKKSLRQQVGNFYELNSNQRPQTKKRVINQHILDGPYTDNVEIKNGNHTQKGLGNAHLDLTEDYSNFEVIHQVKLANTGQHELGGTQKIANLNRYLAEDQTVSSGAGIAYANPAMMGNTTSSLMLKSSSDHQQQYPFQDTLPVTKERISRSLRPRRNSASAHKSPFRSPRSQILTNNMTTLNMDAKFGNLIKNPPQKPTGGSNATFARQQFNIQNGKRASLGHKQMKVTSSSGQNRQAQALKQEEIGKEGATAEFHSRVQYQNMQPVNQSFQEHASSTLNSGAGGVVNVARNEKMEQISGHPYRVIKYNNVSFQKPAKAKFLHEANEEGSVYNPGKHEQQQYLVNLGRSSEIQGQLLKFSTQNAQRGESKASSALSHVSQNVNAEKMQLNAIVMKQPSSSCSKTQMGSLTDKRKYRAKVPQQQKSVQNQGRVPKGANIVPISHHKPNMSHHHSNSSNFSNQNFLDKNLTMNIYQSGFALKNIAGSATSGQDGGPTLINMAITQKAVQHQTEEAEAAKDVKLFGTKQQNSGVHSLKNMDLDIQSRTKVASLEPNPSISGGQRSLLDKTSLLAAPATSAYVSNLTSFNRIQGMSSKQAKLSAKAQQQMPLKSKKSAYNPLLMKQSTSKDQPKHVTAASGGLAHSKNQAGHAPGVQSAAGQRLADGGSSVPSGSLQWQGGISFNSSQQLRGNFYQTQVLKSNSGGEQTAGLAAGGSREGGGDARPTRADKAHIRLSESQGPIGMVNLDAEDGKGTQLDHNVQVPQKARAKSKEAQTLGVGTKLSQQTKKVLQLSKQQPAPEDYGQRQATNKQLLANSSYSNEQQRVLMMANTQGQRTNSLEDVAQRNQGVKAQNQQLSFMNQKQLKIQKNHIIYKAPPPGISNQYADIGDAGGLQSGQVTHASKSSANERSREAPSKQKQSPGSQSQFYLNLLQIQKPTATAFNQTQNTALLKKNRDSPQSQNTQDRAKLLRPRYDEYDFYDYSNSFHRNEATVESKAEIVIAKSNNTNRGVIERSSRQTGNGKSRLQSDRYKSNRSKADVAAHGLGQTQNATQNLLRQADPFDFKNQPTPGSKMLVYNSKPNDEESLEDFRYGMASTQLGHVQSRGGQADQLKRHVYGRPYAHSQLARSSAGQRRQQSRQSRGAKIQADRDSNKQQTIAPNAMDAESQQNLRADGKAQEEQSEQQLTGDAAVHQAVLFEAHNQNLLNILIKEPQLAENQPANGGRNSPQKEAQQRPQLKRLLKNPAAVNSDVQKHHLPSADQADEGLVCTETEMMNATAPINMRQIQPDDCSSRNQTELVRRSSIPEEHHLLQGDCVAMNAGLPYHQRQESGVSSGVALQKKSQRGQFLKGPPGGKQVGQVSRRSQSHLKSEDSRAGTAEGSYPDGKDATTFDRQIQRQGKISESLLKSNTKVNTQKIASPMDYTINEPFCLGTSDGPNGAMVVKKGKASSQNTINPDFAPAARLERLQKGQVPVHQQPSKKGKGKIRQEARVGIGSNAVVHTGHSAASRKLILAEDDRNSQGYAGHEDFQVSHAKHVARPGMSRTAAISNMAGNQLNTPSSDEDEVYGSLGRESGPQEELRVDETIAELADDDQQLPFYIKDDNQESHQRLGILDEDINNQIELLDQLQQLNSLDQSMLNEEQIQQFNELVQIKKDLERSIWDKERKQMLDDDDRLIKDFELNSTQGIATRMMLQMQSQQDEAQLLERLRGSDFSGTELQNCNAIQVGGVSVEIEEAGTILDSANFADHAPGTSNLHSFINTGNLTNFQQYQTAGADAGYRQGASTKRKRSQRPTPQGHEAVKRPGKASKSQTAIKTRGRTGTQAPRENQQAQSNKMMSTCVNQDRNATGQPLPASGPGLDTLGAGPDGHQTAEALRHLEPESLGNPGSKAGAFLPNNMSIRKNAQINKKAEVSSSFTGGSRSKSSVNYLKLMKTTSHIATGIHKAPEMATAHVMPMKQAPVIQVSSQFNLNQTQPISKMKLNEHALDGDGLVADRKGQLASCSGQIVGAEHQIQDDHRQSRPMAAIEQQVDRPYQEYHDEQDLEEPEDMDIDLILGHYEYQNFTDQLIDSNTHQDEVEQDAINYFKIQSENETQGNTQNQMSSFRQEPMATQAKHQHDEDQRSRRKPSKEPRISVMKLGSTQNQQQAKSKRSHLNSKRLSSQMGDDYGKGNNPGQQHYSHQRPSSQADVSMPTGYHKNLMAFHWQLTDADQQPQQKPYDQKAKVKEGAGSDKKVGGPGAQSQNNFATSNATMVTSQIDAKKKVQSFKGQAPQRVAQQKMSQGVRQQATNTMNVSGQVPSIPSMMSGIRNKFSKNFDQAAHVQAPAVDSSLNKKKRSNSRQKQRSMGGTQNAFYPNAHVKQQKLSRNNNNEHLVVKRAQRGPEKQRKASLHSQGSQPGQTQLMKAMEPTAVDIKAMLNESQKIRMPAMSTHDPAESTMQPSDGQQFFATRHQNPGMQPLTSSKMDLVKMVQRPQIVEQSHYDSQGNLVGQPANKRAQIARAVQRPVEQPTVINAQINGKKVKIAKSTKQTGLQGATRAVLQKKAGNVPNIRPRVSSTENQSRVVTAGQQFHEAADPENNAQNYQKVMKTLMELCNQTQNIRNTINDSYKDQMPNQIQLINDYSSQDNIDRMARQVTGDASIGMEQPGPVAVSQSHHFKGAKQKMVVQGQARNATLSNSRRTSKVFLSQQSKEDMPVLGNVQQNLGSVDQNHGVNKHALGSSTGTINYRGAGARAESQICAQSRLQSQPMSKLQSGLTTQLLQDQQIWGGSHQHQQASKAKIVSRGVVNKSPNQPHSLLNTSSNLHDFLRNNKLSIVSQNLNHGAGAGLGSTYAPGGLGFGQIRTLMKLPTFQSSQMNNPAKAVGNFAAQRVQKAAQAAGGSYHPHHQSSGNHSSLLGTLKGGIGIMPNLSNAEFNNEQLNESLRDFEMALEHMAGSTGNMQHTLQKATFQAPAPAGAIEVLRAGHDLTSTQQVAVANQMKLSGLTTHLQGWKAEPEPGSGTTTNIESQHPDLDSRSQQKARKTYQLAQQMMSNLRIHKKKDTEERVQGLATDTQNLHENPLIRELFPEAKEDLMQPGANYGGQIEEADLQARAQEDPAENDCYGSDSEQTDQEQQNDGEYAKDQFYQVQKLQLKDANALEDLVGGQPLGADDAKEMVYCHGQQVTTNNWHQKNNQVKTGVKPKFREQVNPSQRGSAAAKVGQVHLIPKQLVKAAKHQVQRVRPQIEGVDSEEQFRIRGVEDTEARSNMGGRQIERLSSSGSNMKRTGPSKPNAPKASGTMLLKQDSKQSGPALRAYSSGPAQDMNHGAQINKNSSNGRFNETSKVSSSGGNDSKSREGTSSKPQRQPGGLQQEQRPFYPTSKPIYAADNASQDFESQPDEAECSGRPRPQARAFHANAASNVKRAKDEQPAQSNEQRSPLDSGSKLLKRAMRDIKLENNINLRESEKDISGGGSAASDMHPRQMEDEQSVEAPDDSETDDSADAERVDVKPDDEQVYNDKYYEMNHKQAQDNESQSKEEREATNKRLQQLREDLDEKMRDRYQPGAPGGRLNERRQRTKNSGSEISKQNSNNQILIDHNSAYNPSQIGDAEDGVAEQRNRVHNYQFGRQIGEGAYAVVRTATSREDNQKYAIKIYDKSKLSDINRQRSVRREVVLLQKMNHPNIVKLIEAFETDSHVYLVMENVTGGSLHSYLKEMINKQLDEEEARRIFQQILIALKYCHSKCIAHRDIKLENVLLDEHKNVKLIDFGFSTCIPNHKKIRMFCGTPSYMAPQIVSKVEYAGPPADIWATGVLLYALLNGCFPFRGQTDDDLYRRIKRGTYHIYNQRVTREYLDVLQRCLDVNDDTRPSAKDLLDDPWFKITDIRQRAYEEEKRQFKAKILAKVPIIKKTNHTICILAQNPTDVLNKGAARRQDNGQAAQIQQEDEQKNIRSPPDGNATNGTAMVSNQPYNQQRDEESPCMGQGLQGTQTRTGDSQVDQIQSSGGANKQANTNMQATAGVSSQSSTSNHQPYRNICDTQGPPVGDASEPAHLFNNGASDNSANGADYKDQVVMQQDPGKMQQQLTVGVYEGNLISGANLQAGKADGFPRTIILNQNQASLLGGTGLQAQEAGSASLLHQQQPSSGSSNQPGAIVLSYGAAVAPQIHVYQLKKKLNHEAYQAYYNTSSATGVACPPGPNPALTRTSTAAAGPPHPLQGMSALGPLHLNVQSSPVAGAQNQPHNNKMIN